MTTTLQILLGWKITTMANLTQSQESQKKATKSLKFNTKKFTLV